MAVRPVPIVTVTPWPRDTFDTPRRFVPVIVALIVVPSTADVGVIDVKVGAGKVTVNETFAVPPGPVTTIVFEPGAIPIGSTSVIGNELNVGVPMVTVAPVIATPVTVAKLLPDTTAFTVCPAAPDDGVSPVTTGTAGVTVNTFGNV